jgi:8-oxo-dGTP pyrophosphatase MutT (NUDIX family)
MKVSYKYHTFNLPLRWLRCLKRRMRWVRAAGCVVHDDAGNMLLIRRNGRWDLPKGKVESGETLLQAALREAEEETGITPLPTTHYPLPTKTYHTFNLYGGWHLKQTSWFDAHVAGEKPVGKPQDEEGITEVVWVTPDEWYRRLQGSYGTLKTLSTKWMQSAK